MSYAFSHSQGFVPASKKLCNMVQTQLVKTLALLTVKQLKAFEKYLASPYFNTHENTYRFFSFLKEFHPHYDVPQLGAQHVFEHLFPGQPYKDEQLRTLRKYLLAQLINFLALQSWEAHPLTRPLFIAKALGPYEASEGFGRRVKKLQSQFENHPIRDEIVFQYRFQLEKLWYEHQITRRKRSIPPSIQTGLAALDHYYLVNKLQLYCSDLHHRQFIEGDPNPPLFLPEILQHIADHRLELPKIIQAYFLAACFLGKLPFHPNPYPELRQILQLSFQILDQADLTNLYAYAITHANRQYMAGGVSYLQEMFELYQEMLNQALLFEGEVFSVNNYKNIVTLSLRLGHFDWTEEFIESYRQYLPEPFRESVYTYNLAHLQVYRQDFHKALRLLQQVDYLDTFYQLDTKLLQLKIYYELQEVDAFFSLAKTFQTFVGRQQKLAESRKQAYHQFVKVARNLFRMKIGEKQIDPTFSFKISEANPLIEKRWLLKKWAEIQPTNEGTSPPPSSS